MSLAEDLAAAKAAPRTGPRCGVSRVLAELGDDAPALREAMADRSYQHAVIGRVLRGRGCQIQDVTIARHRNAECLCPRDPQE